MDELTLNLVVIVVSGVAALGAATTAVIFRSLKMKGKISKKHKTDQKPAINKC